MQPRQHGGALARQMFLDAGAETEMRPFGIEQHGAELTIAKMLGQRGIERRDHGGIDKVRLRTVEPQPQQAAVRLVPDLERLAHNYDLARGMMLSVRSSLHGVFAASARRSATKSISRPVSRVPSLKARKPARPSVIMLRASQSRAFSLLAFHALSFGLRSSSTVLVVHSGNV